MKYDLQHTPRLALARPLGLFCASVLGRLGLVRRTQRHSRLSALLASALVVATIGIGVGGASVVFASQTECLSYAYACTPGYDATNTEGGWAWKYYGGAYAETPTGYHNCTLYTAWRLEQNGLGNPGLWGNAFEWIDHTTHNNTPAVGVRARRKKRRKSTDAD